MNLTVALTFPDNSGPSDEHLARWSKWILSFETSAELIVVHGNPDERLVDAFKNVRWIVNERPESERCFIDILRESSSDIVLAADGTGTYDMVDIANLLQQIRDGDDVVFANRQTEGAGSEPPLKIRMLATLLRRFFGSSLRDVNTPIVAVRRSSMTRLDLRCTGVESNLELAIKSQLYGLKVRQRHVRITSPNITPAQPEGLRQWWRELRFILLYSPRLLLLLPGLAMLLFGSIGYCVVFMNIAILGVRLDAHTLVVASAALIMGYQSVLFAIISKTFGITSGLMPPDPRITRLFAFLDLERGLIAGAVLICAGLGLAFVGVNQWVSVGLGPLDYATTMRWIVPGMTCIALGFQTVLWGVFASFLGISRRDAKSLSMVDLVHDSVVHNRRVRVLSRHLAQLMPHGAHVLDVGSGDGMLAAMIMNQRPDLRIEGIDIQVRDKTHIPVSPFDGTTIPFADNAFDVVMFVDVLHHTNDPEILLKEAARVARHAVVLKDHTRNGLLAGTTLRFMDRVGNLRHDVPLPYNYWPRNQWQTTFDRLGLKVDEWIAKLRIYPRPADWLFGRSLHFVARLRTSKQP